MSMVRRGAQAALITVFLGGLLGPLYTLATVASGSDPWLGAHAAWTCERVCHGCHGPYATRGGTKVNGSSRGGKASKTYCQPPKGSLEDVEDLPRYEVEDGSVRVLLAGYLVVLPLVFLLSFGGLTLVQRRRARA